ncbi:MAG: hypothetical protein CVV64_15980 [Candidatus Wallbacteria bacterium HGW-Wallbacteria-1]|uniref:DUF218 domain-containing protein n=1 Tax=Candidatus Wallbacteria bacterium HGW-Wallbacteria-1 TaxID=2013854 RepID=A0A2N1PL54_9BACT|nr:MAG: hypothetical protein CVV64_15980 [Candidatus Wallbacteria bacterium HGW-Wallbacteria-1]
MIPVSIVLSLLWTGIRSGGRVLSLSDFSNLNASGNSVEVIRVDCIIVPGARVYGKGVLSDTLRDRVEGSLQLYRAGVAGKILVSGDHGTRNYDEVNAMRDYLLAEGIDGDDIFTDHAGFDTFDTMARASRVFGVRSAVISTQAYHLPRAVTLARSSGIDAYGAIADRHVYMDAQWMKIREILARVKALGVVMLGMGPRFLGSEIPITGSGKASWDRPENGKGKR